MLLLDGKKLSEKRLSALKKEVEEHYEKTKTRPGLAVIRIGDNPASKVYVGKKVKACHDVGIHSVEVLFPESVSEEKVLTEVEKLNRDPAINGILIQLPIPKHLSEKVLMERMNPKKDVDGFHPLNRGKFLAGDDALIPCTPLGIMNLLKEYKIEIKGKSALVIGRSLIVGRPMSLLLDQAGATVTVAHSQTKNLEELCERADIIVVAIGKPHFLSSQKIKAGAVIIDVGINRLESGKLVGDVDFEKYKSIASAITPVPGGVGPMTICSLLENTWKSFLNTQ
ncbi:MAG: Bifunctional protein FolD [Bacteriovoracaceae bacterium]|nr:Bifunctional protein FolD [Bacteriovoracaceae bacterium]